MQWHEVMQIDKLFRESNLLKTYKPHLNRFILRTTNHSQPYSISHLLNTTEVHFFCRLSIEDPTILQNATQPVIIFTGFPKGQVKKFQMVK